MRDLQRKIHCLCVLFCCIGPAAESSENAQEDSSGVVSCTEKKNESEKKIELRPGTQTLNLGLVAPHTKIDVPLTLYNSGENAIEIDEALVSCKCVKVDPGSSLVLPGESTSLDISLKSGSRSGTHTQLVRLTFGQEKGNKLRSDIQLRYTLVNDFELVMSKNRWVFDQSNATQSSFVFWLVGYRGLDVSNVKLQFGLANATLRRTKIQLRESESSRQKCEISFPKDFVLRRPTHSTIIASYSDGEQHLAQTERIALIHDATITVSPRRPRVISGHLVMFVKLLHPPKDSISFRMMIGGKTHQPAETKSLHARLYQLKFNPRELKEDGDAELLVRLGEKSFRRHVDLNTQEQSK